MRIPKRNLIPGPVSELAQYKDIPLPDRGALTRVYAEPYIGPDVALCGSGIPVFNELRTAPAADWFVFAGPDNGITGGGDFAGAAQFEALTNDIVAANS